MADANIGIAGAAAFLFDLDGVIIDSETEYTRIWKEIDRAYPTGVDNFAYIIKGTTLSDILDTYYPAVDTQSRVKEMLYRLESEMVYNVIPGAASLLKRLKDAAIPIALVTSSNDDKMQYLWTQHPQLRLYFDTIVTSDDISRSKPDPEGYILAAERLHVDPSKCVVVEDSRQGVMAGEAAGGRVIGVAGTLAPEILEPHCTVVVSDLSSVVPSAQ